MHKISSHTPLELPTMKKTSQTLGVFLILGLFLPGLVCGVALTGNGRYGPEVRDGTRDPQATSTFWDIMENPASAEKHVERHGFMPPEKKELLHPRFSINSGPTDFSKGEECCGFFKDGLWEYTMTLEKARDFLLERALMLLKNLEIQRGLWEGFARGHASGKKLRDKVGEDFNPFFESTKAARDALSTFLDQTFSSFYWGVIEKIGDAERIIGECKEVKNSEWMPLFKGIKKFAPLPRWPRTHDGHLRALAQYTLENFLGILMELDDFLDKHHLRGTKHPADYTPPRNDPTRSYWKNAQGRWCSGYGSLFQKPSDLKERRTYPLFRRKPITPRNDYSEPFGAEDSWESSNTLRSIPYNWLTPIKEWASSGKRGAPGSAKEKNLEDLTQDTAQDVIFKIRSILPGYQQAKMLFQESWGKPFILGTQQPYHSGIYDEVMEGYRRQLTLLILRLFGPFYDGVQETLRLAEKAIAQGQGLEEKLWKPLVEKWSKAQEPPRKTLLKQDTPEKRLAAAHYLVKKVSPVEKMLDKFLDEHMYLRGEIALFDVPVFHSDQDQYYAYQWNNAHGYPCYGFGRLLSPRKPSEPIPYNTYHLIERGD